MKTMGLTAIYPKPNTTKKDLSHKIYPYLLKNKVIETANEVWSTDITYIRLKKGFMYLVAVIDWFSRYVLSWELSNTLDAHFCVEALKKSLSKRKPKIFNTDQGSQFTSTCFTKVLQENNIKISVSGSRTTP